MNIKIYEIYKYICSSQSIQIRSLFLLFLALEILIVGVTVSQGWTRQFFYWVKSLKCLGWSSGRFRCKSVKAAALKLGLLFYAEDFSRFSAYKRHIFYATRPDLTPTAYYWLNILGRQSESNSHSLLDLLIYKILGNSRNSSYLQHLSLPIMGYIVWENVNEVHCRAFEIFFYKIEAGDG